MAEYIEREALEVALNHRLSFLMAENSEYDHYTSGYDEAVDTVENFPSAADVAPVVHGRWKQCFEDWRQQIEGDKCSACGFEHYGTSINHYHYCPNCGARMDGE